MELQGLQEALKVEIQCHQDGELRRQMHDRQTRITALSDKQNQTLCKGLNELQNGQKLAVRGCPVASLLHPPPQSIAISVVPAKAPVSMVTAHVNGQKAANSEPVNLQTNVHAFSSRRAAELPPPQMLGTLTAVPIKVPQVGSLHRLAGQAATVLPQVRPKSQLPLGSFQELQRATAVVSPRCSFSPEPQGDAPPTPPAAAPPGQDAAAQHASPGVAYAIIAAGNGASAVSEAVKVIIIQPQAPSSTEDLPAEEAPPTPKSPTLKKDEDPEKIAFMVALGLVTTETLEEIQTKRQERKRRSTANPAYSGLFEPERKRLASHYLNSSLFLSARDSEDFCWKEEVEPEELCFVCEEDGDLQRCHSCPRGFHPACLQPPLKAPRGPWWCPKCQKKVLNKENMSWPQNFVQSYVTHKTVRQEEKRRLLRRNNELKKECSHLEEQDKKLSNTLKQCVDLRERLLGKQRETQASLERLRALIRLIQRDQLLQVTMTTTAAIAAAALLSPPPWSKTASEDEKNADKNGN